jgi:hypothetical protein
MKQRIESLDDFINENKQEDLKSEIYAGRKVKIIRGRYAGCKGEIYDVKFDDNGEIEDNQIDITVDAPGKPKSYLGIEDIKLLESVDKLSIWELYGENLPSIFKRTIYRMPTNEELFEVNEFNLDADCIVQGLGYTIVGRGMNTMESKNMIYNSIQNLCKLFPKNTTYRTALDIARSEN